MNAIMVLFHCESNTGYAIGRLEPVFFEMAMQLCNQDSSKIHFAYPSMQQGSPKTLPAGFDQFLAIDSTRDDPEHGTLIEQYIRDHQIDVLFGFDQPVSLPTYKSFRKGGIKHFLSYWGAPMSSIFGPLKRALKRIEVALHRDGPDIYIFESQGMADTAIKGRGIPAQKTRVVYLGVDTNEFHPDTGDAHYVYAQFDIPQERHIFFYSGHMEERKGVWVIMNAANQLASQREVDDWHILLLGNQPGEEQWLLDMLTPEAKAHVTFGGYRDDISRLHRGCYAGVIASSGWDSLTCSSLEMQASGLPLIASNLPGLREAVAPELSSFLFTPGDASELCVRIENLLDSPNKRASAARIVTNRITSRFNKQIQVECLVEAVQQLNDV